MGMGMRMRKIGRRIEPYRILLITKTKTKNGKLPPPKEDPYSTQRETFLPST